MDLRQQMRWSLLLAVLWPPLVVAVTTLSGYTTLTNGISYNGEVFNSTDGNAYVNCSVDFIVNTGATMTSGVQVVLDNTQSLDQAGQEITCNTVGNYTAAAWTEQPEMKLAMTLQMFDDTDGVIFMYIENVATDTAFDVQVNVDLTEGLEIDYGTLDYIKLLPAPATSDITVINGTRDFIWNAGNMTSGESLNASFSVTVDKKHISYSTNFYTSDLTYQVDNTLATQELGPVTAAVCIDAEEVIVSNVLYQHGFTALSFFMALILGILLVIFGFFIYFMIRRKKAVSPANANQERLIRQRGKNIMMSDTDALKRGGHTINQYSAINEGDSIVGVLGMKDKMQMHREIDSLDLVNTVNIDTGLERERNEASMQTTELLIGGLHSNKDISKGTMDSVIGNLRSRRSNMDRSHDDEYKREMKKLYKRISAKNRAMMSNLIQRQRNEKRELINSTQSLPDDERNKLLNLLTEQHQSEQNAETFKLKLEQDEETENLRKEMSVRARMGMKEIQQQALTDVIAKGDLSKQQADWLLAQHLKNQKALEAMYDEEIGKQRMVLDEKLARRKALAQAAETEEEDQSELLNTVAGHQIALINKMKKLDVITYHEAEKEIEQAKKDMVAIKDKMDRERSRQESELHRRLSALKQKRLADLEKQHEMERKEYDKRCQAMQTDGPIDPVTYADGRLKLLSQQRLERSNLENEIDLEHTDDLTKLRNTIFTQTEGELKGVEQGLLAKSGLNDRSYEAIQKMLRQHEKEVGALKAAQDKGRQTQLQHLQERLQKAREEASQRKEAEKTEQEQLREYEDKVVSKLVNSQVSMSDDERDRILKEHEKQMVKLENSLTLNKLRQKRMIEEKLAQKRAIQMEKLQLKQHKEKEVQRRRMENNAEESDDDSRRQKAEMMKEHVEQKMAVLHGRKLDWDTELESIRIEMLKERSLALMEQEERLGTLIAGLQFTKAKEMAKIEEQQRAIHNLKTNLIDDLNARGVLSDPETQDVISRHQQEQEQLNHKLEDQRELQDKMLKQKLHARLEQREKSMIQAQDEELKNLVAPNKTAAKIKKMLLIHKHMVAMEIMRNQLEREISQTLEQVKYEYEVCRRRALQNQEFEFIAGLVRVGTVPKEQLETILQIVYPNKSEAEYKEMFDKIYDPNLQPKRQADAPSLEESQLIDRVKMTQMNPGLSRQGSMLSMISSRQSSLRRSQSSLKKSKKTPFPPQLPQDYQDNRSFSPHPEPLYHDSLQRQDPFVRTDTLNRQDPFRQDSLRRSEGFGRQDTIGRQFGQSEPLRRESYEDNPHPLEETYPSKSYGKQNGLGYANAIMDDDDVVSAQHVSGDYMQGQMPARLPPVTTTGGKRKKKKKFLKKKQDIDDDEYL